MALVKSVEGQKLLVQISDGGSPAVYAHDCLINQERGNALSANRVESEIPDCDNPEAPDTVVGAIKSVKSTISGAGMLHTASIKFFTLWLLSGEAKSVRFKNDVSAANGGGWTEADYHLTAFEVTGTAHEKSTATLTLESTGPISWADAS